MFERLAMIYTENRQKVQMKVKKFMVKNSSLCFAKAQMLQLELAGQTLGHSLNPLINWRFLSSRTSRSAFRSVVMVPTPWRSTTRPTGILFLRSCLNNWSDQLEDSKGEQGSPKQYPFAAVHKKLYGSQISWAVKQTPNDLCKKSVIWSASRWGEPTISGLGSQGIDP